MAKTPRDQTSTLVLYGFSPSISSGAIQQTTPLLRGAIFLLRQLYSKFKVGQFDLSTRRDKDAVRHDLAVNYVLPMQLY